MAEKEYIEREALIDHLKKSGAICGFGKYLIKNYPAADVAPVKHGHWIYKKRTKLISTGVARTAEEGGAYVVKKHITVKVPYCSICGERGGDYKLDATPFCPDCGAKMDGEAIMAEYIERNAMLKTLENSGVLGEFAKFLIKKQPAVDAVEVVRCKDCKHYHNSPNGLCYLHTEPCDNAKGYKGEAVCVEENSFCSYGERKDE